MNDIDHWTNDIHTGDAGETLAELPESSVHMVMTSPPYWNLRDYGADGQLGREETAEAFVQNLADVFDEVKRVLRPDGSLWLNLGDTYNDKDLQQIPARVALELQNRGWILRNRVTWAKPNPMPQSVKDRLNDTTEAVFHFVKNKEYWYDLDAVREAHKNYEDYAKAGKGGTLDSKKGHAETTNHDLNNPRQQQAKRNFHENGKNPGDVFEVTTKPFPDAHFAVYPPELCEKPIKATCPPKVCADCGSPYERDKTEPEREYERGNENWRDGANIGNPQRDHDGDWGYKAEFHGWQQTCDCGTDATEAGIALDPFAGAGTTALVAKEHGRRFVGIDLNEEYVSMAQKRLGLTVDNPEYVRDDAEAGLEDFA